MSYELRHLRAFLGLAEHLHFTRAAERMNMSQPALSRAISELEAGLGVALLRRTTRQVELTEAGGAFRTDARAILRHVEISERNTARAAAGLRGTVRIAYTDFAIGGRLPDFLRLFSRHYPDVNLDLTFLPTTQQRKALMQGTIDVGFLIGAVESDRIHNFLFDEQPYLALVPLSSPLAEASELRLADLAAEPFVMGSEQHWEAHRDRVFILCHQAGFFPRIVQEPSNSGGIFGLVAAGCGVSIYAGDKAGVRSGGLVIHNLHDVQETVPTFAAWSRQAEAPAVRCFVDFLATVWGGDERPTAALGGIAARPARSGQG